jgi:hypothetical protein
MHLTDEQARTKWCPHVRGIHSDGETGNRHSRTGGDVAASDVLMYRCIASDCMAWRIMFDHIGNADSGRGYCGLAGKVGA